MVKKYNKNIKLSTNFNSSEFACKDGTTTVLIDDNLIIQLEKIRAYFKKPITVISGYRTKTYNTKVGGAKNSMHLEGKAADICISGVTHRKIAEYAESLKMGGIGLYEYPGGGGFCHVDTRSSKARWLQTSKNGSAKNVSGFVAATSKPTTATTTKRILKYVIIGKKMNGTDVTMLQTKLNVKSYKCGAVDGIFGKKTRDAVKRFQKANGLKVDGIVGEKTYAKLGM